LLRSTKDIHYACNFRGPEASKIAELPEVQFDAVPYRKLFWWSWYVISAAFGWFLLDLILTLSFILLSQYNVQVLASVVSGLGRSFVGTGEAAANAATASSGGFLAAFLPSTLQTAAITFAIIAVLIIFLKFLEKIVMTWSNSLMLARLQQRLHDKLLNLGPGYHQSHELGETLLIVTRFASEIQPLLRDLMSFPVIKGIGLVTAMIFLTNNLATVGKTPLWIQMILLASIIILPLGGWRLSLKLRQAYQRVRNSDLALANEFSNSASMPLEVQLMGAERQRSEAFCSRLRPLIHNRLIASLRLEIATQFQLSTPIFLQTIFLIYGVFFALQSGNPAAPGAILAIYYFVPEAVGPLQDIFLFFGGLQSNWPQVEKVVEILEAEPEVQEKPGAVALDPRQGALVLENLTFAYSPEGEKILDDLSYAFAPGKITAIVARAGVGKSTLLNLVARLHDPAKGRILIDDQDIATVTLSSLRRHVAKVSQFPLFIADTIRANFKLSNVDSSDEELEEVCRRTGLWEVLQNAAGAEVYPLDYVLPRTSGEGLSGGQRRLLAVTRALLLHPAILLLDEPTTGIDALGVAQLAPVLREACQGLTVLLVDHDMEFIYNFADWICCLDHGRFNEAGTSEELAGRPGLFKELLEAPQEASSRRASQGDRNYLGERIPPLSPIDLKEPLNLIDIIK
jgi:ABC-type multidrug transport system fused ATPase/permease subunit